MSEFTWGCDPELMLTHEDELKSAIGVLPRREKAIKKNGNAFYFDNVLAEIAVKPAKSRPEAIENIQKALHDLSKLVKPYKFAIRASGVYPKKELNCPQAKIAGCNPEWDIYSLQQVLPPDEDIDLVDGSYQFKTSFRSAGGHIHLGSDYFKNSLESFNVIRMMDLFLGIPSIFLDTDITSKERRRIYGHAGSHRMPEHGIEYRPLGNFWLSSPELTGLMYDLSEFVIKFVKNRSHERFWSVNEELLEEDDISKAFSCFGYDVKMLKKAINTCNKKMADKFMLFIGNYLPNNLLQEIYDLSGKPLQDPYVSWGI